MHTVKTEQLLSFLHVWCVIVFWNFRFVLQCFCLMLNIQYKKGWDWGCPNTPSFWAVISISCLQLYLFHTFTDDVPQHICSSPPSLSISLFVFSQSPSLSFSSHLYLCPLLSWLPFSYCHPSHQPTTYLPPSFSFPSPSPILSFSLSLSCSLHCVLMNCLPLLVNSTDNPGEAVKDHRSALQTGPQATALEQHANNKPLHLAHSLCTYVHVCMSQI